jgi:KDO2-lipid IV(A) lauroyltransferase
MFGKRVAFYLFLGFVGFMRITPFWLLYRFSDGLYFLMSYVVRYRKSVILKNLRYCFPDKSDDELNKIRKDFYQRLCDIILESIKGYTLSEKELLKRFVSKNHELTYNHFEQKKDIFLVTGHFGNWEWGNAIVSKALKHSQAVFYKPISNQFMDRYVEARRKRFGAIMVSIYHGRNYYTQKKDKPAAYFLVADQYPTNSVKQKKVVFFGKETAFLHGPENFSKQLNAPVYYIDIKRIKRGHYGLEIYKLTDNAGKP